MTMAPLGELDSNMQKTVSFSEKENATTSKKRKSDVIDELPSAPEIADDDPRLHRVQETCNQVRKKIKDFIGGGNMKVGEFQFAIGVSPGAYRRFMNQSATYGGSECDTYYKAYAFFKKRELQGLKATPPKRAKKSEKNIAVDGVKLDGESTQTVPVYDTCDEIRKKIRAFLRKPGVTQAAFCREIAKSFPEERKIQSRQLTAFLDKKGVMSGNTSCVFYGAYVFFEKLRIKEGKPKSKTRQEMEKIHADGVNTTDPETWWTFGGNERPVYDKYGCVHFVPG